MKKLFTLFAMLTLTVSVMAQTISYQAVLRDTTDGKNELVRNDTGNVVFSVMAYQDGVQTSQKLAPKPFKTNADGMLSLPVDFSAVDGNIDWRNNQITAVFAYGEGYKDTIVLVTPVSAVPYAAQAKDGDLTTGVITTYINSTANDEVPDFNLVWNALMANGNLTKAMRDSIADYLKDNYKYAKEILYSYMSQVTADDMREAYAQVRNLPQETKDAIDTVLKRYLQKHRDLVIEVAEYYALTATEEEVRTVYNDLKSNGPAAAKIRELLYDYFGRYMEYKGLVCEQTTTGQPANLCEAIAAMNAGGSTPAELTYLTVTPSPSSSSAQTQRFYYMPDDTYGQALVRTQNQSLGWSSYLHPENKYITIYIDGFGDLYVNGDSDFMEGSEHVHPTDNNFDVKLETHVSPNDVLIFGAGR